MNSELTLDGIFFLLASMYKSLVHYVNIIINGEFIIRQSKAAFQTLARITQGPRANVSSDFQVGLSKIKCKYQTMKILLKNH